LAPAQDRRVQKLLVQRLHRLEHSDQPALAQRLDDQTIAVAVHDRFVTGQFELHRDADRLIAAVAE
jgi:hypothetical protein